jgi:hypothetical protein
MGEITAGRSDQLTGRREGANVLPPERYLVSATHNPTVWNVIRISTKKEKKYYTLHTCGVLSKEPPRRASATRERFLGLASTGRGVA